MRNEAITLNEEAKENAKVKELVSLEKLCYNNFSDFYQIVLDKNQASYYEPVFTNFNAYRFYLFFLRSTNEKKWIIVRFFANRYESSHTNHPQESDFFDKLGKRVEIKAKQLKGKNIEGFIWSELQRLLTKIISVFL